MLQPGPYLVCHGREALELVGTSRVPAGDLAARACAEGQLAPHGVLELAIPEQAMTRALAEKAD